MQISQNIKMLKNFISIFPLPFEPGISGGFVKFLGDDLGDERRDDDVDERAAHRQRDRHHAENVDAVRDDQK